MVILPLPRPSPGQIGEIYSVGRSQGVGERPPPKHSVFMSQKPLEVAISRASQEGDLA